MKLSTQRSLFESSIALIAILGFSLTLGLLTTQSLKLQLVFAVLCAGVFSLLVVPEKRPFLLAGWILIQPLSIEKLLYTFPPIWEGLTPSSLLINMGDVILLVLTGVLFWEKLSSHKKLFVWDKSTAYALMLFVWGLLSFLVHYLYYQSPFITTAPLGVIHLIRNFFFILVVQSAIQTKSDLKWVLYAVALSLVFQSFLVCLSFVTGESYNFLRLIGDPFPSQTFDAGGVSIARGSGTLGQPNNQSIYHVAFTFLALSFLAFKSNALKILGLLIIMLSAFAVILTFSRGAWLAIFMITITSVVLLYRRNDIQPVGWLVGAFMSIAGVVVLALLAQPLINRITDGDNGATGSRIRMIELAKDLAIEYPVFGVSPGAYAEAGIKLYPPSGDETEWVGLGDKPIVAPMGRVELAQSFDPGKAPVRLPLPVHNKYMLTLSEMGVVGLVLWLMLLWNFSKVAYQSTRLPDPLYRHLGIGAFATVIALAILMMLDLFADDKTLQILLFPMILSSVAYRLSQQQTTSTASG